MHSPLSEAAHGGHVRSELSAEGRVVGVEGALDRVELNTAEEDRLLQVCVLVGCVVAPNAKSACQLVQNTVG